MAKSKSKKAEPKAVAAVDAIDTEGRDGPEDPKSITYLTGKEAAQQGWDHVETSALSDPNQNGFFSLETVPSGGYEIVNGQLVLKESNAASEPSTTDDQQQDEKVADRDVEMTPENQEQADAAAEKKKKKKLKREALKRRKQKKLLKQTEKKLLLGQPNGTPHSPSESDGEQDGGSSIDNEAWGAFGLHDGLLAGLRSLKFQAPTPIQKLALPAAILKGRDVVACAETGSGKTLAFGLPVLHSLLTNPPIKGAPLSALILTPTRELAMQVADHLLQVLKCISTERDEADNRLQIATLVGGMALPKQRRVLTQCPPIVVATPGRLRAWIDDGNSHLAYLDSCLRFLVVDEADRMFDRGHFPELTPLIAVLARSKADNSSSSDKQGDSQPSRKKVKTDQLQEGEEVDEPQELDPEDIRVKLAAANAAQKESDRDAEMATNGAAGGADANADEGVVQHTRYKRQTLLFSATLMSGGHKNKRMSGMPLSKKLQKRKRKQGKDADLPPVMKLIQQIGLRGKPAVCVVDEETDEQDGEGNNMSGRQGSEQQQQQQSLPDKLSFWQINCAEKDKDVMLYYFLTQHHGRTLIFVNTISSLKRLAATLQLLNIPNLGTLHAHMQQRQRLKHLDRFRSSTNGVLVASDVAARGLDIPNVDHVIHHGVAPNAEIFLHRSGRTARANASGVSVSLVAPSDASKFTGVMRSILATHGRSAEDKGMSISSGLPLMAVNHSYMPLIKDRCRCARQLQKAMSEASNARQDREWMVKNAESAGVILDERDGVPQANAKSGAAALASGFGEGGDLEADPREAVGRRHKKKIVDLRRELTMLLGCRLIPDGMLRNFVTVNSETLGNMATAETGASSLGGLMPGTARVLDIAEQSVTRSGPKVALTKAKKASGRSVRRGRR